MIQSKPVYADRGWDITTEKSGKLLLTSTHAPDVWQPNSVIVADCRCTHPHYSCTTPEAYSYNGHGCGIVALKHSERRIEGRVKGEVGLFGNVREFLHGFRADKAFINQLYTNRLQCNQCWHDQVAFSHDAYKTEGFDRIPLALWYRMFQDSETDTAPSFIDGACDEHLVGRKNNYFIPMLPILEQLSDTYNIPLVEWEENDDNQDK